MSTGAQNKPQGLAVAGLILGIVGCTVCLNFLLLPSILGIVFSVMARKKVREGTGGGEGAAKAGLICGVVGLVLSVLFFLAYVLMAMFYVVNGPQPQLGPF